MGGAPLSPDDAPIPDEAELWRRLPYVHWVPGDAAARERRASSAAFDDDEMSVVVAAACTGGEATLLRGHEGFGIARFTAGDVRSLGGHVVWAPDEHLPGHAHISGFGGRQARKTRRELATRCRVDPEPTDTRP
jgi:hypothetical protein